MSTATMTSKGQLTVPKDVRDDLGLTPGTKVTFTRTDEGDYVLSRPRRSVKRLRGRLVHEGPPKSLEEMQDGIRRGAAESTR